MQRSGLTAALAALLLIVVASPAAAEDWSLDPAHASVVFKISHADASDVYGMFKKTKGTFTTGDQPTFDITVAADSIDTGNDKRDQHLKGPDFFNVRQFPTITFKSTSSEKTDEGYRVTGDLTLHGVTQSITVEMTQGKTTEVPPGTPRTGFTTTFEIERSDFGIDYGLGMVGDTTTLMVSFEGTQ